MARSRGVNWRLVAFVLWSRGRKEASRGSLLRETRAQALAHPPENGRFYQGRTPGTRKKTIFALIPRPVSTIFLWLGGVSEWLRTRS